MRRAQQLPGVLLVAVLVLGAACSGAPTERGASGDRRLPRGSVADAVLVAQPIVPVPDTIDYTGATDVTDALQSFIDEVDDGVVVRFRANGKYRVEGTLFVTNKSSVTFDGQNATILAKSPGTIERSQWWITGGDGLIFRRIVHPRFLTALAMSNEPAKPWRRRTRWHWHRIAVAAHRPVVSSQSVSSRVPAAVMR